MSAKKAHKKKTITLMADDPEALKGTLKCIGGSQSDYWNNILANQAFQTLWLAHSDEEARSQRYSATVAALIGIGPKVDDAFFHKRCNERTTQRRTHGCTDQPACVKKNPHGTQRLPPLSEGKPTSPKRP